MSEGEGGRKERDATAHHPRRGFLSRQQRGGGRKEKKELVERLRETVNKIKRTPGPSRRTKGGRRELA